MEKPCGSWNTAVSRLCRLQEGWLFVETKESIYINLGRKFRSAVRRFSVTGFPTCGAKFFMALICVVQIAPFHHWR